MKPNVVYDPNEIDNRCDLSGLLIDSKKYHVNLLEGYVVEPDQLAKLRRTPTRHQDASDSDNLTTSVILAWHKVINVFAGGDFTVISVSTHGTRTNRTRKCFGDTSESISVLDHNTVESWSCGDAALSLEQSGLSPELITHNGEFDSHIRFAEGVTSTSPSCTHPVMLTFSPDCHYQLDFAGELFSSEIMSAFCDTFEIVLSTILKSPSILVRDLEYITREQAQSLDEFNSTNGVYDREARLNTLIERSALATPSKTAVIYKDQELSYQDLNDRANQLAHYMHLHLKVQTEQIVGLFLRKSALMITTVVSIWKAGAAYTPIDVSYPDARCIFSLEDTGTKILLTTRQDFDRAKLISSHLQGLEVVDLDTVVERLEREQWPTVNPAFDLRPHQLCYLTYTSGTTGKPKGIKKRHTNVVNSITDLADRYEVKGDREAIVLFSPYVFEPFARQTLMALANSQTLVVVDDDEKLDPVAFGELLQKHRITYLNGTASVLLEYDYSNCPDLKRLVLVGENLDETRYHALRRIFSKRIINEYGFTESAFVTAVKMFQKEDTRPNRSLGRPLRNVKCYILNKHGRRLPPGAVGGLYIGGQGIAEGYWNRPELTAEKFLLNPFQTAEERSCSANSRMYYTGDLARWIPGQQEIEFCGRVDFQIKLRGIRIEPAEIEAVLAKHKAVQRALVVAKTVKATNTETQPIQKMHLVGYWTGDLVPESELISYLETILPRYMVPTRLIHIDRIPTTINGKIDFRALPSVELVALSQARSVQRPTNPKEIGLREIWAELLGIPERIIGIDDSFLRLGGHSVVAIQLIGLVRRRMHYRLTIEQVFAARTIQKLAELLEPLPSEPVVVHDTILPESVGLEADCVVFPGNSLMQGFFFHYLKTGGQDVAYAMQTVCSYAVDLDIQRYKESWLRVQKEYSALRLRFVSTSQIYQVIDPEGSLDFCFTDASEEKFRLLMQSDLQRPYTLEDGSLFRVNLVRTATGRFNLLFSAHHAILDGWSIPILLDRVHELYVDGVPKSAASPDHAFHATQRLMASLSDGQLSYWRDEIDQVVERCDLRGLVVDDMRYKVNLNAYDTVQQPREISINLSEAWSSLQDICTDKGIVLHTILQFAAAKVIQAYGNGKQSVVGTIVSGRDLPIDGIEEAIGLFINTLPLVVDHEGLRSMSVLEALQYVQQKTMAMNSRSCVELGKLTPNKMVHELFDCLLVLENYPTLDKVKRQRLRDALQLHTTSVSEKITYPLVFVCTEEVESKDLDVTLRYAAELFSEETVKDVLDVFGSVFGQIAERMSQPVTSLQFLGPVQLARLASWNTSDVEYPQKTLDVLFEETANDYSHKTAVIYESDQLTYAQLNKKANQLARWLQQRVCAKPDQMVALFLEKNINMFIAILAVWKAGMAYVPIDPNFPADRISYILEDTAAVAILPNASLLDRLDEVAHPNALLCPIESAVKEAEAYEPGNLEHVNCTTDLAYIYFTSGTTGRPKGVMIEHRGVVNLQRSLEKTFELRATNDEVLLSFSNYTFDHFVEQMTDALLTGSTLLILNDEMRADKDRLYAYISRNQVTYLSGTPSVISMYDYAQFPWLRRIDCVGEDFSAPIFDKIRTGFKGLIINGYGPTEVSITSHKRLYPEGDPRVNKSIGHQIDNSRTYVLNPDMTQVPIGAIGELFLGGDGVGRGYLGRTDLTEQRFPPNPYQSEKDKRVGRDARLYKTGDLVRWLPTGEIEYLGREDHQIKLRGQRVELGEIEAALTSCANIVQSVVVPRSRKIPGSLLETKYLTGYFVATYQCLEVDIKNELRQKLPEHLIPNRVVQIETIPVTVSGKLDPKKLPEASYTAGEVQLPPSNDTERRLCDIWGKLLGHRPEEISVADHFISLGGDSLLSTRLSFMMSNDFSRRVTVADIFKHRSIRNLASFILRDAPMLRTCTARWTEKNTGPARASLAQERLLFIDDFLGGTNAYNVLKYLTLPHDTSRTALRIALCSLLARHEACRTLLTHEPGTGATIASVIEASHVANGLLPLQEINVQTTDDLDELLDAEAQITFHLQRQLPLRIVIAQLQDPASLVLAFNIHHSAFDAWSWNILERDLIKLYQHHLQSPNADLARPLAFSHAAYSKFQRQSLDSDRSNVLKQSWIRKLEGYNTLELATDFPRPSTFDHTGGDVEIELGHELMKAVRTTAERLGTTPYSVFTAAYCLMLRTYALQNDITIGMPMANRTECETEDVVGCFMNMVALRIRIDPFATSDALILQVQDEVQFASLNQDYPFEELVRNLRLENTPDRHPLFQHVFSSDIVSSVPDNADNEMHWKPTEYKPRRAIYSSSKVDLSTTVTSRNNMMIINFNFPLALFERGTIRGFASTYHHLLLQMICPVNELVQIDALDLKQADPRSNSRTDGRANGCTNGHGNSKLQGAELETTLVHLFSQAVLHRPDALAVVSPHESVTYKELDRLSTQTAQLLAKTVGSDCQFVGLMFEPCLDMLVSVLACWKLGLAYVPMDPRSIATERMKHIAEESAFTVVLSHNRYKSILEPVSGLVNDVIFMDDQTTRQTLSIGTHDFTPRAGPESLAYLIYTSGSTGRPKGVQVTQANVVSFVQSLQDQYFGALGLRDGQSVLLTSSYVFDFSIEQMALSILSGNKLVLLPDGITADTSFYDYLHKEELSYISGTPSVIAQLDLSRLPSLQMVTAAGEQLQPHQFARMREGFSGPINNAYGTTETTVYSLVQTFASGEDEFFNTLGKPLPGQRVYVANESLQLLPVGAIGELLLSGPNVTEGYLNRPEMTRDRFIPNPFGGDARTQRTIYRTGDIVRRLLNGALEFRGRKDKQFKIRGFRVELDEIQTVLSSHPEIEECVVLPKTRQGQAVSGRADFLIAYFRSKSGSLSVSTLIAFLEQRFPSALVPSYFVEVQDKFPTTVTGKLDVDRLPEFVTRPTQQPQSTPASATEACICQMWSSMLGTIVGPEDDVFKLGADSIICLMFSRDSQKGPRITVKDIFEHRTVRKMLQNVDQTGHKTKTVVKTEHGLLEGPVSLLPIQQWFFEKDLPSPDHWNQAFVMHTPRLDMARLRTVLDNIQDHHDALRLSFTQKLGCPIQKYLSRPAKISLHTLDDASSNIVAQLDKLQSSLDLSAGCVAAMAYIPQTEGAMLWMAVHHLVIDTQSWRILARDMQTLYEGGSLAAKGTSYRQWATAVNSYVPSSLERVYWQDVQDACSQLDLPFGPRHAQNAQTFHLSKAQTQILLASSSKHQLTTQDVLLTTFGRAAFDWSNSCIPVTVEGHGRAGLDDSLDVSRTVGWFTTMYPVCIFYETDLQNNLKATAKNLKAVPNDAIAYGAIHGYGDLPLVSFNYLGRIDVRTTDPSQWQVEGAMDEDKWGRWRAPGSERSNSGVLDVTAFIGTDGFLSVELSGMLAPSLIQRLCSGMQQHLEDTVHLIETAQTSTDSGSTEFIPYFTFMDSPRQGPITFFFPPGEGGAESYFNNLVSAMSTSQIVTFNNIHLHSQQPEASFETLAGQYISWMKEIQPSGPYHLLGWSFGGVLALEVAIQLLCAGQRVTSLSLIDSYLDVANISTKIGHGDVRDILDPINWYYSPNKEDLSYLENGIESICLFKAGLPNERARNERQEKLFGWYHESEFNGLDSLVPGKKINVVPMEGETHFTWVRNAELVKSMALVAKQGIGRI